MTLTAAIVDGEAAVHDWIRAHPDLTAPIPGGAHYAPLRSARSVHVVVTALGGLPDSSDAPVALQRLSLDVWAPTKELARAAANALSDAVWALQGGETPMGTTAICHGAVLESLPVWAPDPNGGLPRYVITATFMLRAA